MSTPSASTPSSLDRQNDSSNLFEEDDPMNRKADDPIPGHVIDSQLSFYNLKKDPNYVHPNLVSKYPPSVVYKQLFGYLKPYLGRVIAALLITIPAGALEGAPLFMAKPFLDSLVHGTEPVVQLLNFKLVLSSWMIAGCIVGFALMQGVLNYFSIYLSGWLGSKVMITIQQDLFRKLQTFDIRYFDRTSTGVVIQRFFRDAESLQAGMINNTRQVLTRGIFSIVLMSVLFTLSRKLALLAMVIMICIMMPTRHVRGAIKKISEATLASSGAILSFYTDTVGGSRVIYGYNLQNSRYNKFKDLQRNFLHKKIKRLQLQGWLTSSMQIIAAIGIAWVVMWGSQMVYSHELAATSFLTFMGAMIALYNPLKNVGDAVLGSTTSFLASQRIFMMLGAKMVISDRPNAKALVNVNSCIKFDNVSFFYDYEKMHRLVLRDINLQFNKGEMVALVGPSGGGKTRIIFHVPSRALIGYQSEFLTDTRGTGLINRLYHGYAPFKGEVPGRRNGALISIGTGDAVAYALFQLQDRGIMFVNPGDKVYDGMIVGEHNRDNDLEINILKGKQLSNMRASGKDEAIRLVPPKMMGLEEMMAYIEEDELVEVTPKSLRLRKKELDSNERKKADRDRKKASA